MIFGDKTLPSFNPHHYSPQNIINSNTHAQKSVVGWSLLADIYKSLINNYVLGGLGSLSLVLLLFLLRRVLGANLSCCFHLLTHGLFLHFLLLCWWLILQYKMLHLLLTLLNYLGSRFNLFVNNLALNRLLLVFLNVSLDFLGCNRSRVPNLVLNVAIALLH